MMNSYIKWSGLATLIFFLLLAIATLFSKVNAIEDRLVQQSEALVALQHRSKLDVAPIKDDGSVILALAKHAVATGQYQLAESYLDSVSVEVGRDIRGDLVARQAFQKGFQKRVLAVWQSIHEGGDQEVYYALKNVVRITSREQTVPDFMRLQQLLYFSYHASETGFLGWEGIKQELMLYASSLGDTHQGIRDQLLEICALEERG